VLVLVANVIDESERDLHSSNFLRSELQLWILATGPLLRVSILHVVILNSTSRVKGSEWMRRSNRERSEI